MLYHFLPSKEFSLASLASLLVMASLGFLSEFISSFLKAISLDLRASILLESKPLSCMHLKLFCSGYFHFTNKEGRELNFQHLSTSISKRKFNFGIFGSFWQDPEPEMSSKSFPSFLRVDWVSQKSQIPNSCMNAF